MSLLVGRKKASTTNSVTWTGFPYVLLIKKKEQLTEKSTSDPLPQSAQLFIIPHVITTLR